MLLAHRLIAVLGFLNAAAQLAQLGFQRVDAPREINEALIVDHGLDATQARIDITQLDRYRVNLRRGGATSQCKQAAERQQAFHDRPRQLR